MEKSVTSLEETKKLAEQLAKTLESGDVLALWGDLGTGKTTFTRYLVEALGINARVQSPSFVIARKYEKTKKSGHGIETVNHIDLYRLKETGEVADLGLEEYFQQSNGITIIEWPERAKDYLPKNKIDIKFKDIGRGKRKIYVQNLH